MKIPKQSSKASVLLLVAKYSRNQDFTPRYNVMEKGYNSIVPFDLWNPVNSEAWLSNTLLWTSYKGEECSYSQNGIGKGFQQGSKVHVWKTQ